MPRSEGSRALADILRPPVRRLTQAQLARELDVSAQAVSDWLRGDSLPRPELMAKIEDITGVPMRSWTVKLAEEDGSGDESAEAP